MYGKIVEDKLILAGDKVPVNNGWATKPSEEQLLFLGYLPVIYTEPPSYDEEEEKLVQEYIIGVQEEKNVIYVEYNIVSLTDEEHNQVIQQKIIEEENKITPRRQREIDLKKEGALEFAETVENNIIALRRKFR